MSLGRMLKERLPAPASRVLRRLQGWGWFSSEPRPSLDDDAWFELQFRPGDARREHGIPLPSLPPDEVQMGFTARAGRINLQQAFSFYKHMDAVCHFRQIQDPRVLDFGGGWGRISRFFLRDTKPEHIAIADCMAASIHWLQATGNPCRIIKNDPLPPIAGLDGPFDLIYAFSVFSHLSEPYLLAWITYFLGLLRPNGYVVFTTRGEQFIDHLEELHRGDVPLDPTLQEHVRRLRELMPSPQRVRERHRKGEFQFYPIGGAGELSPDFFGETFIPRSYIEKHFGSTLVDFREDVPDVDQSVVVLRKHSG